MVGHETQVTIQKLKPKAIPARREPAKRMPSARASRKVPNAATNSFKAAISARERQSGSTYAGTLKGEKTADCALPRYGRPP